MSEMVTVTRFKPFQLSTEPLQEGHTYCSLCCKPWTVDHSCMGVETVQMTREEFENMNRK